MVKYKASRIPPFILDEAWRFRDRIIFDLLSFMGKEPVGKKHSQALFLLFRGFFGDVNNKIPSLRGFIVYWLEQLDS